MQKDEDQLDYGNLIVTGALTVKKGAILKDKLTVEKDSTLKDKLTVEKEVTLKDTLTVEKDAILKDKLVVEKGATLKDKLIVEKDATLKGKLVVEKDVTLVESITVGKFSAFNGGFQSLGDTWMRDLYVNKKLELKNSSLYQPDSDIAKLFYQSESQMKDLEQGDVVRLAKDGGLERTNTASDPLVVGVVSKNPRLMIDTSSIYTMPQNEKDNMPFKQRMLVTHGVARCRVWKAKGDKINVGDLLTSAGKEGAAMLAPKIKLASGMEIHVPGTIIGRALEPHDIDMDGIRLIRILVIRS